MCGVLAIVSPEAPVDERRLARGIERLSHRGPDGSGIWISEDARCGLAHARLSVIDPRGGRQPLCNEDGSIQAAVNGELYGFEEIRAQLERDGHRFATGSDSEILVHLYEKLGTACLARLRGEFAFVLWDGRNRQLFAARDRFGIKPLVYSLQRGTLYVASEAKALFACGLPAAWDEASFFNCASMQYVPLDRTLFAQVRQLPPGHCLRFSDGQLRLDRYWDMDYPRGEDLDRRSEAELTEELRLRFDEAVRIRMRADVPVACHLSGGIDSTSVLASAARHAGAPVRCFTVSFEESGYDELAIAERSAAHYGAALTAVRVSQPALLDCLSDAVYHSEGLAVNGHLPAKYLLSRAVRDSGYKVVLTGEGSDEIFAGYPHLRHDLIAAVKDVAVKQRLLEELHASNRASAGIMLAEGPALPLDAVRESLGFVPSFLEAKAALGLRMHALLEAGFKARFEGRDCFRLLLSSLDVPGQLWGRERASQSMYLWSRLALTNYILRTLGDGTEMASSIEGRLPFLDHELFGFVKRLPVALKIREGTEKYLLRQALADDLPAEVYSRRKHPFVAPPLSSHGRENLQDLLRSGWCDSVPFFDWPAVRRLLDQLSVMPEHERSLQDPALMTVLSAALLQRRMGL